MLSAYRLFSFWYGHISRNLHSNAVCAFVVSFIRNEYSANLKLSAFTASILVAFVDFHIL
jgi:hypothetical protein